MAAMSGCKHLLRIVPGDTPSRYSNSVSSRSLACHIHTLLARMRNSQTFRIHDADKNILKLWAGFSHSLEQHSVCPNAVESRHFLVRKPFQLWLPQRHGELCGF